MVVMLIKFWDAGEKAASFSILFKDEIDRGRGQRCRQSRRVEEKQLELWWMDSNNRKDLGERTVGSGAV